MRLGLTVLSLAVILNLVACSSPPSAAFIAPDGRHWVALEQISPTAESESLVPVQRLTLQGRWHQGGPVILEGVETLCATQVMWNNPSSLLLRLPADRAWALKARNGQEWDGVRLTLALHEDQVKWSLPSPDGQRRLVVIQDCETEAWNLYLRRAGEPNYNEAMKKGWDDPDLFGGLDARQPPLDLKWTGPRSAVMSVPGKSYGVTLRQQAGDVRVTWKFVKKFNLPKPATQKLAPIKP